MSSRAELCNIYLIRCGSAATRMNTEAYGSRRNVRRERNDQLAEGGHGPLHFYRQAVLYISLQDVGIKKM